jgi:signal transduction histidine kinase
MNPVTSRDLARSERRLIAVGVVLSTVVVAMSFTGDQTRGARPYDLWAALILFGAYGSLWWCRRAPVAVAVVAVSAAGVWFPLGYAGALPAPALLVAIFALMLFGKPRHVMVVAALNLLPVIAVSMIAGGVDSLATAVGIIGWMVAAALLGDAVRQRRLLVVEYDERLRVTAAEQQAETDRQLAEERLRIARDLHDVLAHTVTAISITAAVAGDLVPSDHPAAEVLRELRQQTREAVDDVRRSVGAVRDGEAVTEAVPGIAAISGLVANAWRVGVTVECTVDVPVAEVPEIVSITAYRIVQEALTNVHRHSQADTAVVTLALAAGVLTVDVVDPGPRRLPVRAPGFGLLGMRERAGVVGGTLEVGPDARGGFHVSARLPVRIAVA